MTEGKSMKTFLNILIIIGFFLVSFFGLGPVLFADGAIGERLITLLIVVFLYCGLTYLIIKNHKK